MAETFKRKVYFTFCAVDVVCLCTSQTLKSYCEILSTKEIFFRVILRKCALPPGSFTGNHSVNYAMCVCVIYIIVAQYEIY